MTSEKLIHIAVGIILVLSFIAITLGLVRIILLLIFGTDALAATDLDLRICFPDPSGGEGTICIDDGVPS